MGRRESQKGLLKRGASISYTLKAESRRGESVISNRVKRGGTGGNRGRD